MGETAAVHDSFWSAANVRLVDKICESHYNQTHTFSLPAGVWHCVYKDTEEKNIVPCGTIYLQLSGL